MTATAARTRLGSRRTELGRASRSTVAAPADIWQHVTDHTGWPDWLAGCQGVSLTTPLRCSGRGRRHLRDGSSEAFVVTTLVPRRTYAETVRLVGAKLESRREILGGQEGTEVVVSVTIRGVLSRLYRRRLTRRYATTLPAELTRLLTLAEGNAAGARRSAPVQSSGA